MLIDLHNRNIILKDESVEDNDDFFDKLSPQGHKEVLTHQQKLQLESGIKKNTIKSKLWQILIHRQHRYLKESYIALKSSKALEGFSYQIPLITQQCYSIFAQALANAKSLKHLDLSGTDLYPLLTIELCQGIQQNATLKELDLSACRMNSFSLQYLFTSLSNHKNLQSLNIYNNQGFTIDLMTELREFIFKGKNQIKKLKLTHCNIDPTSLSFLFRNIKHAKNINQLDVSMMMFNTEILTSLVIGLEHYKGKNILESLNLSGCWIKNDGLNTLAERMSWNISNLKIKELILKQNKITQNGVVYLEKCLKKIDGLQRLDLSNNEINIKELFCPSLLQRKLYELNLKKNNFITFPINFFPNALVINLSSNNITSKGAFQLSAILRTNPSWIELNLSYNQIQSEGFNALIFGLRDNQMLKKLIVANTGLDGESIICYMINHEQLYIEYLDVSFNRIRFSLMFVLLNYLKHGYLRCLRAAYIENDLDTKADLKETSETLLSRQATTEESPLNPNVQKITKNAVFQITSFNLRELDFHGNDGIFSPVITSLATYYNKIETLDLSQCKFQDHDIINLALFLQKTSSLHDFCLRDLNLGNLKKPMFKLFSKGLGYNQCIKRLNLSKNKLNKYFKTLVKYGLKSYNLESLDLSQNFIENRHADSLELLIIQLKNLQDLNLSKNTLNFHGINAITKGLKHNKRLKSLNLSHQKLTADDLLMIASLIAQGENLQTLNLSNNLSLSKVGTFFQNCSLKKQESLSLSNMYLDQFNFNNLKNTVQQQKRYLKGIQLSGCIFQKGQFKTLFQQMHNLRHLQFLNISQNPSMNNELVELADLLQKLKDLRVLKITATTLNIQFCERFSLWLKNSKCNIVLLDLSRNFMRQKWLDVLSLGIEQNKSVQNLVLSECRLGTLNMMKLGNALNENQSITHLDLSLNQISSLSNLFEQLKRDKINSLSHLNLSGNKGLNHIELHELFYLHQTTVISHEQTLRIKYLDMTDCDLGVNVFDSILNGLKQYGKSYGFSFIQSLVLENNKLGDDYTFILREILERSNFIQELNLAMNCLTSQGVINIFQGMMTKQTIRILDISQQFFQFLFNRNKWNDSFIGHISQSLLKDKLKQLEFLHIHGNQLSAKGVNQILTIMEYQIDLFVNNQWNFIGDKEAIIILNQYKRIGQKYKISQNDLPQFLCEISITQSNLSDLFCKSLAEAYPHLNFIEQIDLSDNVFISMYGKVYLFIHLFDPKYDGYELSSLYITDSSETRKLFDDGVLRHYLLRLRNFLYPPQIQGVIRQNSKFHPTKLLNSQGAQTKKGQIQAILGGLCGAWILHKINKILAYLDNIEPPQFIVSNLFIGKFREQYSKLRIANIITLTIICIGLILSSYPIWEQDNQGIWQLANNNYYIKNCKALYESKDCANNIIQKYKGVFYYLVALFFTLSFLELMTVIMVRKKINPAFQIISQKLLNYLHTSWPHRLEIIQFFISVGLRLFTVYDFYALELMIVLTKYDYSEYKQDSARFSQMYSIYVVLIFFISVRFLIQLMIMIYNLMTYLKTSPQNDQAEFLTALWKKSYFENFFSTSNLIGQFCPIGGWQINKSIKINHVVALEAFLMVTSGIPLMIVYTQALLEYQIFLEQNYDGYDVLGYGKSNLLSNILKEVLRILVGLLLILTTRPSVIKQHEYNQALTIKQFYKNKSNFVQSNKFLLNKNIDAQKESNSKETRDRMSPIEKIKIKIVAIAEGEDEDEEEQSSGENEIKQNYFSQDASIMHDLASVSESAGFEGKAKPIPTFKFSHLQNITHKS